MPSRGGHKERPERTVAHVGVCTLLYSGVYEWGISLPGDEEPPKSASISPVVGSSGVRSA